MPYRKRGGQGQKSARRLENSTSTAEISKRLADLRRKQERIFDFKLIHRKGLS